MGKFIIIIALFAVSIATFVMYIRPTYDNINEVKVKVTRLDDALSKTRNIRSIRQSLSTRFSEFSDENLERLQKMLPDHVDNVRLVLDMDGVASQYGIRLKNVTIQDSDNNNGANSAIGSAKANKDNSYQSLVLQFEVAATYNEFIRFLSDLESSLRIVDLVYLKINPINTSRSDSDSDTNIVEQEYNFTIALKTYWLK